MKIFSSSKILMAALPLMVALGMMPAVATAHDPGFVHNATGEFTKVTYGCLHTARWTPDMGECGIIDSDGDGVPDDKDKCPGTPKGVEVNADGCGDSDGDGVADNLDECPNTPAGNAVDARGCENIATTTIGDVNFDFDRATLKDSATAILDDAAAKINRNASAVKSVSVTGYTDSTGPEAYNQALSERRANTVKSYLEGKGVNGVTATGKGEADPVGDNSTRDGRAQNRRVEIDVNM